ncbi:MAG: ArsR family transcriptional regulator [Anaerolineales bacterium]|nr:ArsR family transcriptional regulator [Anaerolineales bacterium]
MVTTRSKILAFLEKRGQASALELSNALKLTPANIRHHLRVLQSEGVVVPIHVDRSSGRGRPACLYALSDQQKAHNLDRLCAAFLLQVRATKSFEEKNDSLRSIAQQLIADRLPSSKMNLTQRLISTTKLLNEMSYKASWEAHREAPTIKFSHCPYATLVEAFPELCQIDVFLLETLMACPIEVLGTRQISALGETICRFRVR